LVSKWEINEVGDPLQARSLSSIKKQRTLTSLIPDANEKEKFSLILTRQSDKVI